MFQNSVDDLGMAVIVGLLVILTTSLVASPQDTDGASLPISALSLPPTQHLSVNTKTNSTTSQLTEPQTNLLLQSNVSQADHVSNISHPPTETTATPIQQSDTSDITTVAVTTTASEKIATTTDVSSQDTTTITETSQTLTPTTVSPNITTSSTPSSTTPHTVEPTTNTTPRTIVTTSPSVPNTTSVINTTTTSFPPSSIPPSSVSPATTPTTSVPQTSPTTSPSAPHHTGASIALTLFILVAVILLIGAVS